MKIVNVCYSQNIVRYKQKYSEWINSYFTKRDQSEEMIVMKKEKGKWNKIINKLKKKKSVFSDFICEWKTVRSKHK